MHGPRYFGYDLAAFDFGKALKIALRPNSLEMVIELVDASEVQATGLEESNIFGKAEIPPQPRFRLRCVVKYGVGWSV